MNLGFADLLALSQLASESGMAHLRLMLEKAPGEARDEFFRLYPNLQPLIEAALARDPAGAFELVAEQAEKQFGVFGRQQAEAYRPYVYQLHGWLKGELDKPRAELPGKVR